MSKWQLMETAPKDGTPVILCGDYEETSICEWRGNRWCCMADGKHAIEYMSDFGTEYIDFTMPKGWMPVPEKMK